MDTASKAVRKFRQINRIPGHDYLAKEVHFVEIEPGKIRSIIIFDDGTQTDGVTVDEKIHRMNLDGFDILSKGKDGADVVTAHHTGMLEDKSWQELVEPATVPVEQVKLETKDDGETTR